VEIPGSAAAIIKGVRRDVRAGWSMVAVGVWTWAASAAVVTEESVWPALASPGAVVVLRHSFAPGAFYVD
jgi:hypothetical protein